jgi:hypothetical protein
MFDVEVADVAAAQYGNAAAAVWSIPIARDCPA